MTALNRKLVRDLRGMAGQAGAIAAILACGVAMFVMAVSTLASLERAVDRYYSAYRFADVFAHDSDERITRAAAAIAGMRGASSGASAGQGRSR